MGPGRKDWGRRKSETETAAESEASGASEQAAPRLTPERGILGRWRRQAEEQGPVRPSAGLPRFAVAATDELGDAAAGMPAFAPERARLALADALSASQPVTNAERFAGRRSPLSSLIAAIEQQRAHVVLYGERGIGKTSLIHVFAEVAREARYLVLYGSCGMEARFDEMFRAFAAQIPLLYHSSISPTADEGEHRRSFADLLGDQPLAPRELASLFGEIVGTRVVIILDEYDRVADAAFRRDIAELIKNLSDRAARVQLVLTGVASNLDELVGFTPSIRRNIMGLPLGPMPDQEAVEILRRAEDATGLQFDQSASELILRMAGGSPYLVRLLGGRSAARALDGSRSTVQADDVLAGTEVVLGEWNAGLPRRVQAQLQRAEVRSAWTILIASARASGTPDGWFMPHDVAAELPGADVQTVRDVLDGLPADIDLFDRDPADHQAPAEPRYRFRTQGLAQLLGLSAALARAGR